VSLLYKTGHPRGCLYNCTVWTVEFVRWKPTGGFPGQKPDQSFRFPAGNPPGNPLLGFQVKQLETHRLSDQSFK